MNEDYTVGWAEGYAAGWAKAREMVVEILQTPGTEVIARLNEIRERDGC